MQRCSASLEAQMQLRFSRCFWFWAKAVVQSVAFHAERAFIIPISPRKVERLLLITPTWQPFVPKKNTRASREPGASMRGARPPQESLRNMVPFFHHLRAVGRVVTVAVLAPACVSCYSSSFPARWSVLSFLSPLGWSRQSLIVRTLPQATFPGRSISHKPWRDRHGFPHLSCFDNAGGVLRA